MSKHTWRRTDDGWETREGELTWQGWIPDWQIWREAAHVWWVKAAAHTEASGPYVNPRQAAEHVCGLRGDAHETVEMPIYQSADYQPTEDVVVA
jgi:hypothetical protein